MALRRAMRVCWTRSVTYVRFFDTTTNTVTETRVVTAAMAMAWRHSAWGYLGGPITKIGMARAA